MTAQATRVASVPPSRADRAGALIDHYHAEHAAIAAGLPGSSAPWVALARRDALASFAELGFPNAREEAWKYTPVTPIEKRRLKPAGRMCVGFDEDDIKRLLLGDLKCHRLVFVNGQYTPQLSKPGKLGEGCPADEHGRGIERGA